MSSREQYYIGFFNNTLKIISQKKHNFLVCIQHHLMKLV